MIALDTNVVVRLVVADDPAQTARVRALVASASLAEGAFFVSPVVVCETGWVLDACYRFGKEEIVRCVGQLLDAQQLRFDDPDRLREALSRFRAGAGQLADYVILGLGESAGCSATATFDQALLREPGFVHPSRAVPGASGMGEGTPGYGRGSRRGRGSARPRLTRPGGAAAASGGRGPSRRGRGGRRPRPRPP